MDDAAVLLETDSQGNSLWHPSTLADFGAIPARVWDLWLAMRDGLAARNEPWAWWRMRGVPTSHHYQASPFGPTEAARCGYQPGEGAEMVRDAEPPLCSACTALIAPRSAGWGRIGDTYLGPDGHPLE